MCGRFVSTQSPAQLGDFFGAVPVAPELAPSHNVAPTNDVYGVVALPDGHREVQTFHWGLVPSWAKDEKIGSRMINARAETLAEKPSFKGLFARRRLLVPMDGFYEWRAPTVPGATKTPMFVHRSDGGLLAAAGLWSTWRDPAEDDRWLHSCTVITVTANVTMRPVHDRMPAFLAERDWAEWLDPANHETDSLAHLLVPAPDDLLVMRAVRTLVNSVRNKGAELIEPAD